MGRSREEQKARWGEGGSAGQTESPLAPKGCTERKHHSRCQSSRDTQEKLQQPHQCISFAAILRGARGLREERISRGKLEACKQRSAVKGLLPEPGVRPGQRPAALSSSTLDPRPVLGFGQEAEVDRKLSKTIY